MKARAVAVLLSLGWYTRRESRSRRNTTFDGDTASFNAVYTDESLEEVRAYLNTKAAYVDPRGGLRASANVATVALVLRNMTGAA